jgi:hypothetical protein
MNNFDVHHGNDANNKKKGKLKQQHLQLIEAILQTFYIE